MIFGRRRQTVPVPSGTQSVGIIGDTDPWTTDPWTPAPGTGSQSQREWTVSFPFPVAEHPEPFSSHDSRPSGSPVSDFLSSADMAVLRSRCAVVVTISPGGEGFAVTALHPSLFPPEAMTDALFDIVRSASEENLTAYAALVPSPCPPFVRSGHIIPFCEVDAIAAASPLLWPSLSASPFKRPPAEGRLTHDGRTLRWPRDLVLGGSLPGEPFSLPPGQACWRPLGWSP